MEKYIIIVAGGSGSRMGAAQPKQFLPLNGKAILQHSIECFHRVDPTFKYIVVLPEQHADYWANHCRIKNYPVKHEIVFGGPERFYSVRNAVEQLKGKGIAAIHDAVRPLVSKDTIKRVLDMAAKQGNAVPVIEVEESLRKINSVSSEHVNRRDYRIVQTPQAFDIELLKHAYRQAFHPTFTDDASVVEASGVKINLVEGNRENIKITHPKDIKLAEFYLGI